jgi:hypothetical protein
VTLAMIFSKECIYRGEHCGCSADRARTGIDLDFRIPQCIHRRRLMPKVSTRSAKLTQNGQTTRVRIRRALHRETLATIRQLTTSPFHNTYSGFNVQRAHNE